MWPPVIAPLMVVRRVSLGGGGFGGLGLSDFLFVEDRLSRPLLAGATSANSLEALPVSPRSIVPAFFRADCTRSIFVERPPNKFLRPVLTELKSRDEFSLNDACKDEGSVDGSPPLLFLRSRCANEESMMPLSVVAAPMLGGRNSYAALIVKSESNHANDNAQYGVGAL